MQTERITFDQFGRVFQQFDASGDNRGVRYVYNTYGYLEQLQEARYGEQGRIYWFAQDQDAWGNVTRATLGNQLVVRADYDPATGWLMNLWTDGDANNNIAAQNLELIWDKIGNLTGRIDHSHAAASLFEAFDYDDRNRLRRVEHKVGENSTWSTYQVLRYDVVGRILFKSDVSGLDCGQNPLDCENALDNYSYGSQRPHAVIAAGPRTFDYDDNGNVTGDSQGGNDRSFTYTTFNRLRSVTRGGNSTHFYYGPNREKVLKHESSGSTHYVGNVEIEPGSDGDIFRRYIGDVALTTFRRLTGGQTTTEQVRYLHKDHLGSVTAITDHNGNVVARMAYDAWGQRRDPVDLDLPWQQWTQSSPPPDWHPLAHDMLDHTPRGYTGHEQVDDYGIVHMGGRIYDPHLGRFLQADPFVEDSTTLNRYTYVHNNPLSYTDPSGFFSWKKTFRQVAGLAIAIAGIAYGDSVGGWTGFWTMTTSAFAGGYLASGTVMGAFTSSALVGGTAGAVQLQRKQSLTTPTNGERSTGADIDHSAAAIGHASERTMLRPLRRPDVGEPRDLPLSGRPFDYAGYVYNEIRIDQLEAIHRETLIEEELWLRINQSGAAEPFWEITATIISPLRGLRLPSLVEKLHLTRRATYWTKSIFKGTRVYQRNDLTNPALVDKMGRTNLQRMQRGYAPIGPDGKSINLHHMTQRSNSSLAEMTATFHQRHSRVIHINPNSVPSGIDRAAFDSYRRQYWINRAKDF